MKRLLMVLTAVMMVTSFAVVDADAGLFGRRKSRCCQPTCCEPVCEPTCYQPAPCCEPAPAPCGCEVSACGCCETSSCCHLSRRELRRARRNGCCVQTCSYSAPACGCETAAPCGCGTSSACGCGAPVDYSAPMMEGGPAPDAAAPEAAPEAPINDSTT